MSCQTITLPEGFAPVKIKKFMRPELLECYENQDEWNSFLSPAQKEMFGSERSRSHPMNSAFKLYLEQLEFVKNEREMFNFEELADAACEYWISYNYYVAQGHALQYFDMADENLDDGSPY